MLVAGSSMSWTPFMICPSASVPPDGAERAMARRRPADASAPDRARFDVESASLPSPFPSWPTAMPSNGAVCAPGRISSGAIVSAHAGHATPAASVAAAATAARIPFRCFAIFVVPSLSVEPEPFRLRSRYGTMRAGKGPAAVESKTAGPALRAVPKRKQGRSPEPSATAVMRPGGRGARGAGAFRPSARGRRGRLRWRRRARPRRCRP